MSKEIILIYPPATLPTSPYSSLAFLKQGLRDKGISASCIDLNVEAYEYWLSPKYNELLFDLYQIEQAKKFFRSSQSSLINAVEYRKHRESILNFFEHLNSEISPQSLSFGGYLYPGFDFSLSGVEQLYIDKKDPINRFYDFYFNASYLDVTCVGISVTYDFQLIPSLLLSYYLKKNSPSVKILIGGASLRYFKQFFFQNKWLFKLVDIISLGDGISPITNYINGIPLLPDCIHINSKQEVEYNEPSSEIDLFIFNTPDYSDLFPEKYFTPTVTGIVLSSIGCYYGNCSFCVPSKGKDCSYHLKPISQIQTDITKVKHDLNTDLIFFGDDCLNINWINKLLSSLNELIYWQGEFRFEKKLNYDILLFFKEKGCLQILLGLESASQRILELMNKGIQIENVKRILDDCKNSQVLTNLQTIIGFPTETIEEAYSTVKFLYDNKDKINSCAISPFSLYSGSDVHCHPEKYKIQISIDNYICEYISEEGLPSNEKVRLSSAFFESISEYIPANKFFLDGPMGNHAMIYYKNKVRL